MATAGVLDARDAIEKTINENDALKKANAQHMRLESELRTELAEKDELLQELEIFKELLDDKPVSYQFWIRDPALMQVLKGKARQWYGPGVDVTSENKEIARSARHTLELFIEEAVRYCIFTTPHILHGLVDTRLGYDRQT